MKGSAMRLHDAELACRELEKLTLYFGMGSWGVMSIRGSAMRPLWLASIRQLRGITVVGSLMSAVTVTCSKLDCTSATAPTVTPRICTGQTSAIKPCSPAGYLQMHAVSL